MDSVARTPTTTTAADFFRQALDALPEPVCIYRAVRDDENEIVDFDTVYVNPAAAAQNGISREAQEGRRLYMLFPGMDERMRAIHRQVAETGVTVERKGEWYEGPVSGGALRLCYDIRFSPLGDGFLCLWRDVTAEQRRRTALLRRVHRDALTGLLNRPAIYDEIGDDITAARRHGTEAVVIYADLDGFKQANDTYGHQRGDELLRRVAAIIQDRLRRSDAVGRAGGDEFLIALRDTSLSEGCAVAEDIRAAVEAELGRDPGITLSLGVAEVGVGSVQTETLIAAADRALYRAKEQGGNRVERAAAEVISPIGSG